MAIRDKMRNNAQQFLHPGEPIQAVFGGQTTSQYFMLLGALPFLIANQYRLVVVTPARILVLNTGKWGMTKPKGVLAELPRNTRLGPPSGLWYKLPFGPETLRVHKRFHKDITAADGAAAPYGR